MGLRQKIIKLSLRKPQLRGELLSSLSSPQEINHVVRRMEDSGTSISYLIRELVLALTEQSLQRGKAEAQLAYKPAPAPAAVSQPPVVIVNPYQPPGPLPQQVDSAIGNLPMKDPGEQTDLYPTDPAPAMPTDLVSHGQDQVNKGTSLNSPNSSGYYGAPPSNNSMPPDLRQLHEIVERFRVLNNVDKGKLGDLMQNVLGKMPDNNLKRRLHSYMETAKHELL